MVYLFQVGLVLVALPVLEEMLFQHLDEAAAVLSLPPVVVVSLLSGVRVPLGVLLVGLVVVVSLSNREGEVCWISIRVEGVAIHLSFWPLPTAEVVHRCSYSFSFPFCLSFSFLSLTGWTFWIPWPTASMICPFVSDV